MLGGRFISYVITRLVVLGCCPSCMFQLSIISCVFFFFFFSSRRRHTRFDCDWSSDVCSSDLSYIRRVFPPHRRMYEAITRRLDVRLGLLFSMPCRAWPFRSRRRAGRLGTWLLSTGTRRKLPRLQDPVSPKRTTVSDPRARVHPCPSCTLSRGPSLGSAQFPRV